MKTQSRAFRASDWAENSPSNRTMAISTQQERLIENSVNDFAWPSQSLGLNPIKYFWRNLKMCVCPIQPERAYEVRRWGEEWQIIAECWGAKLVASNKKDLRQYKGASAKYLVKGISTYAMHLFQLIFFKLIYKVVTILFLLCQYGVWSVDWCRKKTNLKQLT